MHALVTYLVKGSAHLLANEFVALKLVHVLLYDIFVCYFGMIAR